MYGTCMAYFLVADTEKFLLGTYFQETCRIISFLSKLAAIEENGSEFLEIGQRSDRFLLFKKAGQKLLEKVCL